MLDNLGVFLSAAGSQRILIPAIALHDVGVFHTHEICHGPVSAELVRPHLPSLGLHQDEVEKVCSAIRAHDDKSFVDDSKEARALRVLDSIDAFGELGVYRFLEVYCRRGLTPPDMFVRALASLERRRQMVPTDLFRPADNWLINSAYSKAKEIMQLMLDGFHGKPVPGYAAEVYKALEIIDWDVYDNKKLEKIIHDAKSPSARDFFLKLWAELFTTQ